MLSFITVRNGVLSDINRLGKLTDNAYIESFKARVRQECLNQHCFLSLADAQKAVLPYLKQNLF